MRRVGVLMNLSADDTESQSDCSSLASLLPVGIHAGCAELSGVGRESVGTQGTGLQYAISGAGGYTAPTSSRIVMRRGHSRHRSYNGAALPTS